MLLRNLQSTPDGNLIDIYISNGRINVLSKDDITNNNFNETCSLIFTNAIVFPGLINSHDHLEFNLFPQLGSRIYNNYVEWGTDIHTKYKETIKAVKNIPKPLRVKWGLYKNLLNGVTTVVNHGAPLVIEENIITTFQQTYSLHSVQLERFWKFKLNNPLKAQWPVTIHIGEGSDERAYKEINKLTRWNILKRDIIGIHGIAMSLEQAKAFKALVWCPDSNYFLVAKTASIHRLKDKTRILFGTDSTVSAHWSIWKQLKLARSLGMVSDKELYNMLTLSAAEIWNLEGLGVITQNNVADIVIAKKKSEDNMEAFFSVTPEDILLVIHQGEIRLFDDDLTEQLYGINSEPDDYDKIYMNGTCKYVQKGIVELMNNIKTYYPKAFFPFEVKANKHAYNA